MTRSAFERILSKAESGNINCHIYLGYAYLYGDDGFPQNLQKAKLWFEKAASLKRSTVFSHETAVDMCIKGRFLWRSFIQTLAGMGDAEAQFEMGEILSRGTSEESLPDIAMEWYRKAASQGYRKAEAKMMDIRGSKENG